MRLCGFPRKKEQHLCSLALSARFAVTLLVVGLSAVGVQSASAQSTTADVVYGQLGSFTSGNYNNGGISANTLYQPGGVALDSSGNLYVADTYNSRVLFYPSGSTTATRVYGQGGSFTSNTQNNGGISANSLYYPRGVALDGGGNLYVADYANNRVLFYPSGSTTATRVYGQLGSFTSDTPNDFGISANSLYNPWAVALDSSGNLYVADYDNNRVLLYPSGSTTATQVYGQGGSFTSNTANNGGVSANSLFEPTGVALDSSGNLYVADRDNNRVLLYPAGGTTATRVYGQFGSFTSNTPNNGGISANSLNDPAGVTLDSSDNLYVADILNSRLLFYPSGSTTATRVYGQGGSFTTGNANKGGISANSLYYPAGVALDFNSNLYVADYANNRVLAYPPIVAQQFVTLPPCRVVDTRSANGNFGGPAIQGHSYRSFPLSEGDNPCGIPATAIAYSLNVTVVTTGHLGFLTIWPTGEGQPIVSTMNSPDGRTKANAAIIPAGSPNGSVSVYVTDTTNVILDINGYFTTSGSSTLEFYPLTPCRIVDTRGADGDLGGPYLHGHLERDFPVLGSDCMPLGINPVAYSFNVTALPHPAHQRLGYLTVWAAGQQQPVVSTLNNPTGTNVANAAIVPAGANGTVAVYPSNDTDLLIDTNGYFAAPAAGGLSLYTVTPCRVLDTRGVGSGQPFQGELTLNVIDSACALPSAAQAFIFNATVVPPGALGYLTLWPDSQEQPVVSTLNAVDGAITSNMAIVPNSNGSIDAYASALTQLIVDISGYFAP